MFNKNKTTVERRSESRLSSLVISLAVYFYERAEAEYNESY